METKHTPGPWKLDDDGFIYGDGDMVADPQCGNQDIDEMEANARLIASAPDLLLAVEDLIRYLQDKIDIMADSTGDMGFYDESDVDLAQNKLDQYVKLIAKAEGK